MSYKTGFYEGRLGIGLGSTMGMGDGNPRYPLDINGDIRLTGSIVNGDGQVLSLVPAESLWTIGNNNLSYAGGNVGIGTQSPTTLLEIKGDGDANNNQIIIQSESYNKGILFKYKSATGTTYDFNQARIWTSQHGGYDTKLHFSTAKNVPPSTTPPLNEAMTIDADGNVGIGMTDPASPLEIKCTAGGTTHETQWTGAKGLRLTRHDGHAWEIVNGYHNDLLFRNLAANGTVYRDNVLMLDDNGNVGIGTASPSTTLHVKGQDNQLRLQTTRSSGSHLNWSPSGGAGSDWDLRYSSNGSGLGDRLWFWYNGDQRFYTNNGTDRMIIKSNGNVGIGTTTPGCPLHVDKGNTTGLIADFQSNDWGNSGIVVRTKAGGDGDGYIELRGGNVQSHGKHVFIGCTRNGSDVYNSNIVFKTRHNEGSYEYHTAPERMRISYDGRVGINITNPSQKLHVNGHVAIGAHDSQPTDATVLTDPNNKQNAIIFYNRYYTWGGGSNIQGAPGTRTWHNFISSKYHSTDPYSGSAGYHAFLLWTYCGHHGTADVAMRMGSGNGNSKIWVNGSTTISSDRRIKTNIMDVPDDLALEMVRKIPCRYYEYKRDIYNEYDYQREKPNRTIGFIAQEVKEICPEAVDITEYKIPLDNKIYRDLDIQIDNSKNFIIIKDYSNNDLSANDEVECVINPMNNNNITQDNYKEYIDISDNQTINIKYISGCNFEILDNIDNLVFEEILLKNKKVDDFHTLDKQKLFALNFSATQELDRKVIALENENAELKAELAAIKQHLGI